MPVQGIRSDPPFTNKESLFQLLMKINYVTGKVFFFITIAVGMYIVELNSYNDYSWYIAFLPFRIECFIQGSHFSATTKFKDFSRNLTPFSRYIFALAANLQLQF